MTLTAFPNGISVEGGVHLTAGWRVAKHTGATFVGGTANGHGDYDGTGNPRVLFTVSGVVEMRIFGVCAADLTGASATLEVGVAGNTAVCIAQTTATDIDANEIWLDATPTVRAEALTANGIINNGANIIETVATANITAGRIDYYCLWRPISDGATVEAA